MRTQPKPVEHKSEHTPFRLEQLFGSKTRARLLGVFLHNPEEKYFIRELTRKIDAQLNSVRREIQNLVELGIVKSYAPVAVSGSKQGVEHKKYFQVDSTSILFADLRGLLQKAQVLLKKNLVHEIDSQGKIDYLALTGKFVQAADVPIDLLIVGEVEQKTLQTIVRKFEQELGEELNYTLMPRDEFKYRKQISDKFLFSILDAAKIVMIDRVDAV